MLLVIKLSNKFVFSRPTWPGYGPHYVYTYIVNVTTGLEKKGYKSAPSQWNTLEEVNTLLGFKLQTVLFCLTGGIAGGLLAKPTELIVVPMTTGLGCYSPVK